MMKVEHPENLRPEGESFADNAIRECPHCNQKQLLSPFALYLWYEGDDDMRYYLFHETDRFIEEYWKSIDQEYAAKGKIRPGNLFYLVGGINHVDSLS